MMDMAGRWLTRIILEKKTRIQRAWEEDWADGCPWGRVEGKVRDLETQKLKRR